MRVVDENQTIPDAQISISQEEEMDMIICDKSDVTYHPETKCMYPCTLSITYVGYSGFISQITQLTYKTCDNSLVRFLGPHKLINLPASVKILQN